MACFRIECALIRILLLTQLLSKAFAQSSNPHDPALTCYSDDEPPRSSPPYFQPSLADANSVARKMLQIDTRRPPERSTWATKGDFPPGTVDFEVPLVFDHETCRAIVSMRPNTRGQQELVYAESFANMVPYIQRKCAQEGDKDNLGGKRYVGRYMQLIVVGRSPSTSADGVDAGNGTMVTGISGNETAVAS